MRKQIYLLLPLLAVPGFFADKNPIPGFTSTTSATQRELEQKLKEMPQAANTERHHRVVTSEPHVAGTEGGKKVADYVLNEFRRAGIEADLVEYDVLLSYPKLVELELVAPEEIELANPEAGYEIDADTLNPNVDPPWHAYAASGELTEEVVYANYGRAEDYEELARRKIPVEGKVVLVRYFQGYRGGKSLEAEKRGVLALIIYSDPAEDGFRKGAVFPDGPWGPETHVQRGANVYDFKVPGDPLTPGWASIPGARRLEIDESEILPRIPTLPISHADAAHILKNLQGPEVPEQWQGGLDFPYHFGPGAARVHLHLEITRERRPIYNVVGRIEGSEEPEKSIILSNHHDAWVYGGVDPSSGTATLLEVARILGELSREGWKPKRTIILGCWDAEEYTLTGSTEWGEQNAADLSRNAVACLNVDSAASGTHFSASAVPSLRNFIIEAARDVKDPLTGKSVLEKWAASTDAANIRGYAVKGASRLPVDIGILGSGSDYTVFFNFLGVPSIDMLFDGPYGVYHSQYDDHFWMSRFGDPGFRYHQTMVTLWSVMATRLADADILPFTYQEYAGDLKAYAEELRKRRKDLNFSPLFKSISRFNKVAGQTQKKIERILAGSRLSPPQVRRINEALMLAERDFTVEEGIPDRPWFKHLIYAPLPSYQAETLPGIREAMMAGDDERARRQLRVLQSAVERATNRLKAALQ